MTETLQQHGETLGATHAMMMLAARTVRHLVSSLVLFENYARHSDQLKELMQLSLLTANHARETAARLGRRDPEEGTCAACFGILVKY